MIGLRNWSQIVMSSRTSSEQGLSHIIICRCLFLFGVLYSHERKVLSVVITISRAATLKAIRCT